MTIKPFSVLAGIALAIAAPIMAPPAAEAQFSNTYTFLKGVRDRNFSAVQEAVEQPGSTVINARDRQTGEGAIHIVVRRRDTQFLLYLLRNQANPNLRDGEGNTAMHIAAQIGFDEGIRWLTVVQADIDAANNRGETPLILAVQQRNEDTVRQLVEAGANPDISDSVVGMSARDYAERDVRGERIRALLAQAQPAAENSEQIGPSIN